MRGSLPLCYFILTVEIPPPLLLKHTDQRCSHWLQVLIECKFSSMTTEQKSVVKTEGYKGTHPASFHYMRTRLQTLFLQHITESAETLLRSIACNLASSKKSLKKKKNSLTACKKLQQLALLYWLSLLEGAKLSHR